MSDGVCVVIARRPTVPPPALPLPFVAFDQPNRSIAVTGVLLRVSIVSRALGATWFHDS